MAVPPLREMIEPLLRVLAAAPDGLTSRQAQDVVADRLLLSVEDRSLKVPGGTQLLFRHRTNWAHDRLKRARLSSTLRKGVWQLTNEGIALVRASTGDLPSGAIREIAKAARDLGLPSSDAPSSSVQRETERLRA